MSIIVRAYTKEDLSAMVEIWNQVVEDGVAFPQLELLDEVSGRAFFKEQSFTGAAIEEETGLVVGLYILHPNNVGRCGHISNASYAVKRGQRGNISARPWSPTASPRRKNWAFKFCSLTP